MSLSATQDLLEMLVQTCFFKILFSIKKTQYLLDQFIPAWVADRCYMLEMKQTGMFTAGQSENHIYFSRLSIPQSFVSEVRISL